MQSLQKKQQRNMFCGSQLSFQYFLLIILFSSHSCIRVLLTCVTIRCFTHAVGKFFIIFSMNFACFILKTRIRRSSFHCTNYNFYCRQFSKHYKELHYKEFIFKYCSFFCSKVTGNSDAQYFAYVSKISLQNCVFYGTECFVETVNQN